MAKKIKKVRDRIISEAVKINRLLTERRDDLVREAMLKAAGASDAGK